MRQRVVEYGRLEQLFRIASQASTAPVRARKVDHRADQLVRMLHRRQQPEVRQSHLG